MLGCQTLLAQRPTFALVLLLGVDKPHRQLVPRQVLLVAVIVPGDAARTHTTGCQRLRWRSVRLAVVTHTQGTMQQGGRRVTWLKPQLLCRRWECTRVCRAAAQHWEEAGRGLGVTHAMRKNSPCTTPSSVSTSVSTSWTVPLYSFLSSNSFRMVLHTPATSTRHARCPRFYSQPNLLPACAPALRMLGQHRWCMRSCRRHSLSYVLLSFLPRGWLLHVCAPVQAVLRAAVRAVSSSTLPPMRSKTGM